jgi:tetratricopeptide (TPR) repeat protein
MRLAFTFAGLFYLSALAVASQAPPTAPTRFDFQVRADFFAGFAGDESRLARAMTRCEEVLAQNPDHPEALVWHGAGVLTRSGALFAKGDLPKGFELWTKGLDEMERAVALAPDNIGVRIPRGSVLFAASRQVPPAQQPALIALALEDYEHALKLQTANGSFTRLSDHAKGELLFGLADGWARAGDQQKARDYFTRLTKDATTSGRLEYATAWLGGKPPASPGTCVGCH